MVMERLYQQVRSTQVLKLACRPLIILRQVPREILRQLPLQAQKLVLHKVHP